MSIYKENPLSEFFNYKFTHEGQEYTGVCHGCTTFTEAEAFEMRIKVALMRLMEQKTLNDLYENCRDMIIKQNPVYLDEAYELAMAKPRPLVAGKHRECFKRNYWDDFLFFMHRMHPDITFMQKVSTAHAEQYISLIRKYGKFREYFNTHKSKPLADSTLNEIHSTIIQVFNLLKSDTGLRENPFKEIRRLNAKTDSHEPYTMDELKLIFQSANDWIYPLFMIGLFSGLRLGDICMLEKRDVIFDRHFIVRKQRKTGNEASIPMHAVLESYMHELFEKYPETEYVLPRHAEQYIRNASTISNHVRKFLEGLGIETMKHIEGRSQPVNAKGIHSLRHTFCTIAGVAGIPEPVVRSIVGHMTPSMTRLYCRHVDERDKLRCIQIFGERIGISSIGAIKDPSIPNPYPVDVNDVLDTLPFDNEPSNTPQPQQPKFMTTLGARKPNIKPLDMERVKNVTYIRNRMCGIIQRMPLKDVQELYAELQPHYPISATKVDNISI